MIDWLDDLIYGTGTYPVGYMSFNYITLEYLPWLNAKTGRNYRLPSESEWEYVARAGTHTVYPWGDAIMEGGVDHSNCVRSNGYCTDAWGDTEFAPVGSFHPNAWGFYDVIGNNQEWMQDTWSGYENYPPATPTDGSAYTALDDMSIIPNSNPAISAHRYVQRGGNMHYIPRNNRVAARGQDTNWDIDLSYGFRLARTL